MRLAEHTGCKNYAKLAVCSPSHNFVVLAPVYCGQMAGWMKTSLGTEVDLGRGHIVLDGVPAAGERGTAAGIPTSFRPMSIVATVAHLSYC